MSDNKKYLLEKAVTEAELTTFVKAVMDGTAQPMIKSAAIPENDMEGDVKIVVGKTLDSIVKDDTKVGCGARAVESCTHVLEAVALKGTQLTRGPPLNLL
jgi:hypothetical protein